MDKRTLIAFVLIGVVLFFYGDFVRWLYPPPPVAPSDSLKAPVEDFSHNPSTSTPSGPGSIGSTEGEAADVEAILDTMQAYAEEITPVPTRLITIDTERYLATITTDGAQFTSLRLKPYKRYLRDGVELIPNAPGARPGYRFWTKDGPVESAMLKFAIEGHDDAEDVKIALRGANRDSLTFTAALGGGRALRITYSFVGDQFQMFTSVQGVNTENLWVRDYAEAIWSGGLAYTEGDTAQDMAYSMAYTFFAGDVLEEQKVEAKTVIKAPAEGQTHWTAIRTKYFIVALVPETASGTGSWLESRIDSTYVGKFPPNRLGVGLRLPIANGGIATPIRHFIGPMDDELIQAFDPSLKRTMNFGWKIIAPFSKAILWSLKALYGLIPNYGICIIIFSILIKVVTFPLTHKSYTSMAAMQRVQPKMTALREKYKGDAQRLNKEMMALYKTEKINPMGGCLPMLLQMPLLYALFIVFRSTIEFRHAPFMLWITDLSLPDFIFALPFHIPMYGDHFAVLPILMAVTQYYQTKMTMTDPNQKMMVYMMPAMMLIFFNTMPSGLTLYYTLFNVWTWIQQKLVPLPKAEPVEAK